MTLKKQLGKEIKKARLEKKLTQRQLCDISHTELVQFGKIERGEFNTTLKTAEKIAEALEKKVVITLQ